MVEVLVLNTAPIVISGVKEGEVKLSKAENVSPFVCNASGSSVEFITASATVADGNGLEFCGAVVEIWEFDIVKEGRVELSNADNIPVPTMVSLLVSAGGYVAMLEFAVFIVSVRASVNTPDTETSLGKSRTACNPIFRVTAHTVI